MKTYCYPEITPVNAYIYYAYNELWASEKMKKLFATILFLTVTINFIIGQVLTINGKVKSENGELISYVNIGIKLKNIGTVSNQVGMFTLTLDSSFFKDTISFSCVGYHTLNLPIYQIVTNNVREFILYEKTVPLRNVVIIANREESTLGTLTHFPGVSGCPENSKDTDILEIAQLIRIKDTITKKIVSVHLFLTKVLIDTGVFRINFYGNQNGKPGERLVESNILRKIPLNKGWLSVNLEDDNIIMEDDFFVSFEFLPTQEIKSPSICYGGAFGNDSLCERNVSQGIWTKVQGVKLATFVTIL